MKAVSELYFTKPWVWEKINLDRVQREVAFLSSLFQHFHVGKKILDLGCGLGYHIKELNDRNYDVIGLDNNPKIIQIAKQVNPMATILYGDMTRLEFVEEFDVIMCLQSVLSYCIEEEELLCTINGIKKALKPGGVVLIDVMNALFLFTHNKFETERHINWKCGSTSIHLTTKHQLDDQTQVMVTNRYWELEGDDEIYCDKTASRLFFPQELKTLLKCNGLCVQNLARELVHPDEDRLFLIGKK